MRELLTFVAQSLVDHPDQVVVRETEGPDEETSSYWIFTYSF